MRISRPLALAVALAAAPPAAAQPPRAAPGVMIGGRVATAIYTTMRVPGSYGHPVPRVPLLIVDSAGQRTALATDDAGTLTVMLRPGPYRVITTLPVEWQGLRYLWDVRIQVRERLPIVDLTQRNATTTVAVPAGPQRASRDLPGVP